jgi:hypothetical protein
MWRPNERIDSALAKHSQVLSANLAGAREQVVAGAGFIGSHVVDQLVRAGCGEDCPIWFRGGDANAGKSLRPQARLRR